MWFHQRQRWQTTSPLTGFPDERGVEVTSGLDHTQQRNMNMFFDLQQNIEHERRAAEADRRAAQLQAWAGDAAMQPPQNPQAEAPQPPPAAEPVAQFDGDDRMCAICQEYFRHNDHVVRLRCRHILHYQCNVRLLENTAANVVLCPASVSYTHLTLPTKRIV